MQYKSYFQITLVSTCLYLSGCAANGLEHRPKVSGDDIANYEQDLKQCQNLAAQNKDLNKTTEGGLAGAAAGALSSAISDGGDVITNAVVGALIGVAGGNYYSQEKQKESIIKCMQDLGYNVVADD